MESVHGSQESYKDKGRMRGFVSSYAKELGLRKQQHNFWGQRAFKGHHRYYTLVLCLSF